MSRLDSFIRRLCAQRDCLEAAAGLVAGVSGPVLELGLGNGRTYDHLRHLFADREVFVFDRQAAAHPKCIPDEDRMITGDFRETLPKAMERTGAPAALIHADTGRGDPAADAELACFLASALPGLMANGGVAVSDQILDAPELKPLEPPGGVDPGRYFLYRLIT